MKETIPTGLSAMDACRAAGFREAWGTVYLCRFCLCRIGFPTLAMGDREGAEEYFYQALKLATQYFICPHRSGDALAGIGSGWVEGDADERGASYLVYSGNTPNCHLNIKTSPPAGIQHLKSNLPPEVLQAALERGKQCDLDQVVQTLLEEWDLVVAG